MVLASVMTLGAFAFMQYLISQEHPVIDKGPEIIDFEIAQDRPDSQVKEITRRPPPPPQPKAQPPKMTTVSPSDVPMVALTGLTPNVDVGPITLNTNVLAPTEGDATPIVRIDPKYPVAAAREGIEGWVKLSFSIDQTGKVVNASVIDAQPKRIFNKAALKALKRWKYRPKVENGQAVTQTGQSVMLEFKLQQ